MSDRFKVILSNKNIYKEVELPPENNTLFMGTSIECDVRLRKDLFLDRIELNFKKDGNDWNVFCSDNLYLTIGDARKLMTKRLCHGDIINIKYQDSDNIVATLEFLIDFDNGKNKYDRKIDVSDKQIVTIGSNPGNNICVFGQYVKNENFELLKEQNKRFIVVRSSTYGVFINGKKVLQKQELKNGDFFSISNYFFYYKNGSVYTDSSSDMKINSLYFRDEFFSPKYPKFSRNTRIKTVVSDEKIEILDPPAKPQKPKNNIITRLLPSLGMLVASGVMASFGGITMLLFSGVSAVMSIVTAVINIKEGNKEYKEKSAERIEKYNKYIENKRNEIEKLRLNEKRDLETIYISQEEETKRFSSFSPDLFDRCSDDEDFLCVRLGTGKVESKQIINYKKQERLELEDSLQQIPEEISEEYKFVLGSPIVCDFKEINALGIVGSEPVRFNLFKNIVIDLVARHYHTDVKIVLATNSENSTKVEWLRFLPNVYNDYIGNRNIVCNDESKNTVFEYLYKELTIRENNKNYKENIVIFLFDDCGFKSHPISRFVEKSKELGVTFVFFGEKKEDISIGCSKIIIASDNNSATLVDTQDKSKSASFNYSTVSNEQAKKIVEICAPVYTEEISLESSLTKNISIFQLLNIISVDDINLDLNWTNSKVYKSMSAPIGVSKTGLVSLDLHDKAHGPHGLVAGTTGSGKSEILQTYILSMSLLFHPHEVGFVIIDFKGGGMVNQFRELPHLMGAITNIDGKEINRSLKSIKAELQKRQRLFAQVDVNHIDSYIKKYKKGEAEEPLPHLIIIVDEFAELKAEQPEFMKELISAARIGRSLGVHLILATQKPSGQVNEQIWSNSRFKLCLKVQSQEDSNEVLKSPLAAEIKEPGRAYLQVGNNEIFELFQSAYSGALERADETNSKEFVIYSLTDSCKRVPIYMQKKKSSGNGNITQLNAITDYVASYCKTVNIDKLPDICLPPLESSIVFPNFDMLAFEENRVLADIGLFDDPDNQYQGPYSVDLTSGNTMIIGSSLSGKTNLLQTVIRSLATKYSPKEVNLYVIDFASMVLKSFEQLNHVGGVVCSNEDEKLKNLFKLLNEELETRKEKLMSAGVSNFISYKEAGNDDLPQIVLVIDNLTALNELYLQDDDILLNLTREGIAVGISVICANSQTSGIGYRYMANFANKIAMFCNDSSEYNSIFDYCRMSIEPIPGRCIIEQDKTHYECQGYLSFEGEKEYERVAKMHKFTTAQNEKYSYKAKRIPLIPDVLTVAFAKQLSYCLTSKYQLIVGLNYGNVSPLPIDLSKIGMLTVTGREGMGKNNFIHYLISNLQREDVKIHVVDNVERRLSDVQNEKSIVSYSVLPDSAVDTVFEIENELKQRYDELLNGNESVLDDSELIVLIVNSYDAIEFISENTKAYSAFENIVGRYKNLNVCVIFGDYENTNISYGATDLVKKIRDSKHFLYFDDIDAMKIIDFPLAVIRQYKKSISVGDCYYINDNDCHRIKTVLNK